MLVLPVDWTNGLYGTRVFLSLEIDDECSTDRPQP
jgi:hypothetical protein